MLEIAGSVSGNARYRKELSSFGELTTKAAMTASDEALLKELADARQTLLHQAGDAAVLDAAGVVAFFNMMTRIVDASGHNNSATERHVMGAVGSILHHRALALATAILVGAAAAWLYFGS